MFERLYSRRWYPRLMFSLSALAAAACAPPLGSLVVQVSGEEAAEEGFRAADLADGWDITFTKLLVSVGHARLSREDDAADDAYELEGLRVIDLHRGAQVLGTLEAVPAGRWDFGFEVAPPPHEPDIAEGVDAADAEAMHEAGFAYWIEGEAAREERRVRFTLGFPAASRMTECTNGIDDTDGVVVQEGAEVAAEITIHTDHFFYDKLGTHAGVSLRFEALAEAAGEDALLTNEELDAVLLSGLSAYEPGSADVTHLSDFITQAAAEMAHLNGEGVCVLNGESHDHEQEEHDHE